MGGRSACSILVVVPEERKEKLVLGAFYTTAVQTKTCRRFYSLSQINFSVKHKAVHEVFTKNMG